MQLLTQCHLFKTIFWIILLCEWESHTLSLSLCPLLFKSKAFSASFHLQFSGHTLPPSLRLCPLLYKSLTSSIPIYGVSSYSWLHSIFFKSHYQPEQWHMTSLWHLILLFSLSPLLFESRSNLILVFRESLKLETTQSVCLHFMSRDTEKFAKPPKVRLHLHR